MINKTTVELAMEAILADAKARTPAEGFDEMVARGVITKRGEVTTLIGGSANPEKHVQSFLQSIYFIIMRIINHI